MKFPNLDGLLDFYKETLKRPFQSDLARKPYVFCDRASELTFRWFSGSITLQEAATLLAPRPPNSFTVHFGTNVQSFVCTFKTASCSFAHITLDKVPSGTPPSLLRRVQDEGRLSRVKGWKLKMKWARIRLHWAVRATVAKWILGYGLDFTRSMISRPDGSSEPLCAKPKKAKNPTDQLGRGIRNSNGRRLITADPNAPEMKDLTEPLAYIYEVR